jgi:GrpB-like predicted nucleotidyltransferase (UPF0157 family)
MSIGLLSGFVEIKPYSEEWIFEYENEKKHIIDNLNGFYFEVEHIGSTSVPELSAKPIIDIMIGVKEQINLVIVGRIEMLGYDYYGNNKHLGGHIFRKSANNSTTHLLHLVALNGFRWKAYLEFRNYLRKNEIERAKYEFIKNDLASRYSSNRYLYRKEKRKYVLRILKTAFARGAR